MRILIFGATGFIGKELTNYLFDKKHEIAVISRNKKKAEEIFSKNIQIIEWDFQNPYTLSRNITNVEVIINLAGENIASKIWTKKHKENIIKSRVHIGNLLTLSISQSEIKPKLLIQASAIGFYGSQTKDICTENSLKGSGFLAQVSDKWEKSTEMVSEFGVKRIVIRTGVVLGKNGGMFPKLIAPIKYFMGSNFGKGDNFLSWIHIHDEIRAIEFLMNNKESSGIYNLVSPNPITSIELNKLIGRKLRRPVWLIIPKFILKLALREMANELFFADQKVVPTKLLKEKFVFKYSKASFAIESLLNKKTA
ncbi:MAG TPA: TIGR01777 family protein [Bacteroidales bacterium]|nr:TIGR01777 family protein [Bacteroidales bacterium]